MPNKEPHFHVESIDEKSVTIDFCNKACETPKPSPKKKIGEFTDSAGLKFDVYEPILIHKKDA